MDFLGLGARREAKELARSREVDREFDVFCARIDPSLEIGGRKSDPIRIPIRCTPDVVVGRVMRHYAPEWACERLPREFAKDGWRIIEEDRLIFTRR